MGIDYFCKEEIKNLEYAPGMSLFVAEMKKRGCTGKMATSKAVICALSIMADSDEEFRRGVISNLVSEYDYAVREEQRLAWHYENEMRDIKDERKAMAEKEEALKQEREDLEKLRGDLLNVETPYGRDRLRVLEIFKRNVGKPKNVYQETAYMKAVGEILAGKPIEDTAK